MISAQWFYIVFRIFHIGAGVAWVGSVYFLVVFVQPTSAAIGPAAAPFMAPCWAYADSPTASPAWRSSRSSRVWSCT
jgi:hypothetical protein